MKLYLLDLLDSRSNMYILHMHSKNIVFPQNINSFETGLI